MNPTWLVLDVNNLTHIAEHTTGRLEFEAQRTGATFGFLRSLRKLVARFDADRLVFCFDYGTPLRQEVFPSYKHKRKERVYTQEEQDAYRQLRRQLHDLMTKHLWALGYKNIFFQQGYEADDVIAGVVRQIPPTDQVVMCSSDKDLYQLLEQDRVVQFSSDKLYTRKHLFEDYGIEPAQWHCVKAIAGCNGDDVPGIKGVKEVTAARFLTGKLPASWKQHRDIVAGEETWKRNLPLVKLPWPGLREFVLRQDAVTDAKWVALCKTLGFDSLLGRTPRRVQTLFD